VYLKKQQANEDNYLVMSSTICTCQQKKIGFLKYQGDERYIVSRALVTIDGVWIGD
jgi:hypothetical protein